MKNRHSIHRRGFLKLSSSVALAGMAGRLVGNQWGKSPSSREDVAERVGTIPRRKLGYSGREVSVLIGAGDMTPVLVEAGAACGMNYWHKSQQWMRTGVPEVILKNREAHYCQVTVDRVGGDHFQGHFDEEEHYRFVREAVSGTGLGYFDDMQLHFGYHNTEELKRDRSFIRAFDRLKKEGLVRHLCLSQHSYDGSPRVTKGQSAAEILTAVVDDGYYEHAQFMYSYGSDPEMEKFLEYARDRNFGTIAMKTARGLGRMMQDRSFAERLPQGGSPYNALVRWLTTRAGVDTAVVRVRSMEEFVETYSGAGKEPGEAELRALEMLTAEADKSVCRMCGKCQSACPRHIPISDILRFERYALDDHDWYKANRLYSELVENGSSCTACGSCVERCPLHLPIPEKLEKAHILMA